MDTWLRTLYAQPHDLPDDLFNPTYRAVITRLLATSETRVACLDEDPRLILGYSVTWRDPEAIHWIYVKEPYRRAQVAAALRAHLQAPRPLHTFRTRATRTFYSRHLGPYAPNLLRRLRP